MSRLRIDRGRMRWLVQLFDCRHARTTFPLTAQGRTYVCCLACGREFDYDWRAMRRTA
jgi:hypothetical protein